MEYAKDTGLLSSTPGAGTSISDPENGPARNESMQNKPTTTDKKHIPFAWMAKECRIYKEEYKDCKSIKARFHQYFLGEMKECGQWKVDYDNCLKWEKEKDQEALQKVIDSEKERVRTRLQAHLANDVWERRESPPENWSSELPDFIKKDYEASYLHIKAEEIKNGEINMDEIYADSKQLRQLCTIC